MKACEGAEGSSISISIIPGGVGASPCPCECDCCIPAICGLYADPLAFGMEKEGRGPGPPGAALGLAAAFIIRTSGTTPACSSS
jgi:hypothetical protein